MNCSSQLAREGTTPQLVERISQGLERDLQYDGKLDGFVVENYKSLDDFVQLAGDETAQYIGKVLSGDENLDFYGSGWEDTLGWLDREHIDMVANFLRVRHAGEIKEWEEENEETFGGSAGDIRRLVEDRDIEEWRTGTSREDRDIEEVKEGLERAGEQGRRWGAEKQMMKALTDAIESMAADSPGGEVVSYKTWKAPDGKESPVWDSPVTEYFPMPAACKLADRGELWEDITNDWQYSRVPHPRGAGAVQRLGRLRRQGSQRGHRGGVRQRRDAGAGGAEAKGDGGAGEGAPRPRRRAPGRQDNRMAAQPGLQGPALAPGGVLWDTENNRPLERPKPTKPKAKPRKRRKGSLLRKRAQEPWQMSEDDYSGRWSEDETEEQSRERYRRKSDWEQSALAALSLGKISPAEARKNGVYEAEKFKPLPEELYHVTTAKSRVLAEGLKSRHELGQGLGKGLGGGTEMSISFTSDPEIARGIYENLLIARKVAAGEMTLDDLIATAERGEGAGPGSPTSSARWAGTRSARRRWTR